MHRAKIDSARPSARGGFRRGSVRTALVLTLGAGCITVLGSAASGQSAAANPGLERYTEAVPGTVVEFEMIPVPGGRVEVRGADGATRHVDVAPLWMSRTEVTWDLYDLYVFGRGTGSTNVREDGVSKPSLPYLLPGESFGHSGNPALGMTFLAAETFFEWLSEQTGKTYRLPTEAEWEHACRAGREAGQDLAKEAWHAGNAGSKTHRVGTLAANQFGLHDMLGNAAEWVTTADGEPVAKGGTWRDSAADVGCGSRIAWEPAWQLRDPQLPKSRWWLSDAPFVGLRIVREP
jgi:formylglycine-generating enzyme required for sulfatase activity